jgi:type IV pilus assembly protein PilX
MNPRCIDAPAAGRGQQRGLSLVTTLLLTVATMSLGVAVMSVSVMQERTIGNTKDRDLALQATEAALRDAEQDVSINITASTDFSDTCVNGLCTTPAQRASLGALASLAVDDSRLGFAWSDNTKVRIYGQYTAVAGFPSVAAQPRYVIEKFSYLGTPSGESAVLGAEPVAPGVGYRITARGVGARPETVVELQSIYATR